MVAVEKQGAVTVVRPVGPLTVAQAESFLEGAAGKLGQGRPMVVIDMHEAPLVDSAGLEALVELRDRVEARGGSVKLAAVNVLCGDILRVTGVGHKFEQYGMVKTAVGSFAE
jgi:anti-anti-sigma factor